MSTSYPARSSSPWRRALRGRTSKVLAVGVAALAIGVAVTQHAVSAAPTIEQGSNYIKVRSDNFKYDKDRKGSMSGWLQVIMYDTGNYNLAWHAHNGTAWTKDYSIACVIVSSSGGVHSFVAKGDLRGTSAVSVRGGDKTDDGSKGGSSPDIRDDFPHLRNGGTADCRMKSSFDGIGLVKEMHGFGEEGLNVYQTIEAIW